jgi:hypothetical protein
VSKGTPARKILWRFATGAALDGRYRTDASWLHWSTATLWPHRVVRWHHMPRLYRAGVRDGTVAAGVVTLWGAATHPAVTAAVVATVTLAAGAWGTWWAYRKLRHFRHHWRYVRPLRRKLTRQLQGAPPRLAIEPDRSKVTIWLPDELTFAQRDWEMLELAVTTTTGLESPERTPQLQGPRPYVIYTRSEPPPARVLLTAIRAAAEDADEHEIVMGLGKKSQVTTISIDNDSPHVGLSMGSGDGKSTVAKNMLAQLLYHGALGLVLDYKLISHMWARGLPNVSYAGTPAEIEEALVWLAREVTRRNRVALAGADIEGHVHASVGPRIFLIAEELNATQNRLKAWWNDEVGEKGRSPGSKALDEVMFLGRQVHINVLQIGQRLSVKASGSGDARENLGVLVFADPTAAAWKMLVGDRHVLPPASGHRGRLQVVTRREVRETQGAFLTGAEARELATAGTVAIPPSGMPGITTRVPVSVGAGHPVLTAHEGPDQAFVIGQAPVVPSSPGMVTLREAAEAGMFPSKAAAHKAALRAGLESVGDRGAAKLYLVEELAACQPRKAARR